MDSVFNLSLMRHPYNWVILLLMILVAGYATALIFPAPAQADN